MRVLKSNKVLAQCSVTWKAEKKSRTFISLLQVENHVAEKEKSRATEQEGLISYDELFFSLFLLIVHFLAKLSFSAALLLLLLLSKTFTEN